MVKCFQQFYTDMIEIIERYYSNTAAWYLKSYLKYIHK